MSRLPSKILTKSAKLSLDSRITKQERVVEKCRIALSKAVEKAIKLAGLRVLLEKLYPRRDRVTLPFFALTKSAKLSLDSRITKQERVVEKCRIALSKAVEKAIKLADEQTNK